jgi:hypothetical protein
VTLDKSLNCSRKEVKKTMFCSGDDYYQGVNGNWYTFSEESEEEGSEPRPYDLDEEDEY